MGKNCATDFNQTGRFSRLISPTGKKLLLWILFFVKFFISCKFLLYFPGGPAKYNFGVMQIERSY
jgi:hypothetical protein